MDKARSPSKLAARARGASVRHLYVTREVKTYAIQENEIRTLGALGTLATIFWSVGSGALSLGLSMRVNSILQVQIVKPNQELASTLMWIFFVIAAVCYGVAIILALSRHSIWNTIRRESSSEQF